MSHWFPIEALIMSELAEDGDGMHLGLKKHLDYHPAIKAVGMTNSIEAAWKVIRNKKANTIFIAPFVDGILWPGIVEFILDVRCALPDIAFVIYSDHKSRDKMIEINPRFKRYFFIEEVFGTTEEEDDYLPRLSEVNMVLTKCDKSWHRKRKQYDIGISYAGEDRKIAKDIFLGLKELRQNKVFFDQEKEHDFLGTDISIPLSNIYSKKCRYAVIILSQVYLNKAWTQHEMKAMAERNDLEEGYIIPITIDAKEIPGLVKKETGYLDISRGIPLIVEKINRRLWADGTQQKENIEIE
jgi:TIR domain